MYYTIGNENWTPEEYVSSNYIHLSYIRTNSEEIGTASHKGGGGGGGR